ncbi:hypothetical protein G6F68_002772 [Rhizopus microsporus]|nr:hypothetical protein G6F67_003682 [Rhizopus microsporus]KAG1266428.1 hypothetical protein G6F68_002772 [Rhizopus microsporus]
MSSLHLPSFNNKLKKKPSFILEKRPNLERSVSNSSTLSKVRRFGSKLIRSKSQRIISLPTSPQEVSPPFELNISPTFDRDSRFSLNESTSSIEEYVKTPTTADFCQRSFNIGHPSDQEDEQEIEDEEVDDKEVDESTLSAVSLVRYHLSMALKQVDEEIEDELQTSHEMMLRNLKSCPRISFK